jgi:hypothetical protein
VLNRSEVSPSEMAAAAGDAAALMKAISNEQRLPILCHLIAADEMAVGDLVRRRQTCGALPVRCALRHNVLENAAGVASHFIEKPRTRAFRRSEQLKTTLNSLTDTICLDRPVDPSP